VSPHFARQVVASQGRTPDLTFNTLANQKNHANLAQDEVSDSEAVMWMAQMCSDLKEEASWYLDSGFSTHIDW